MNPLATRRRALVAVASAALLAGAVLTWPAGAATGTVTLGSNGPTPQTITVNRGDSVRFVNQDSGNHTISSNAGAWSFRATIKPGASATTPAFSQAGSFGYSDVWFIAVVQQQANGYISVKATSPSPTPKPTATRSSSPRPSPTRTASPRPTTGAPSPTAWAGPTPSGLAIGPGIGPLPTPVVTTGPAPNIAPPPDASATPAVIAYGPKSDIAQASAHRYGLPVLLALLGALGVLSLIVRLLLAEPTADGASRRTGEGPDAGR